jgi:hypothetical protein
MQVRQCAAPFYVTLSSSLACKGFAKGAFIAYLYVTFTCALREGKSMRLSIVFDDNGTVLAASASEEAHRPTPGPGVSTGYFNISDDVPEVELPQTGERLVADLNPSKLRRVPLERRPIMPDPNSASTSEE